MIILGLGSNLNSTFGDRFRNIETAISYLDNYKVKTVKKSSFYETPSYPDDKNPKFINSVIQVETDLNPTDLASVVIFIEELLERKRSKKNAPRTCDIDIIDYDNKILNFKYNNLDFSVPHRELVYRSFVLMPLQEILPKWTHPETGDSIDDLVNRLSEEQKKSILKIKKS